MRFDRDAALKAAEIFRKGKEEGQSVPHPDAMISGTYAAHGIEKIVREAPEVASTLGVPGRATSAPALTRSLISDSPSARPAMFLAPFTSESISKPNGD
ncbi:hypothetical protein AKJ57_02090 [candidate division MSBL1 archaeon SCGC-AAA259A05]|uniref:Uncharacterized protein n=1 Tax=candidate division MSBL1 archaeon SCGC-AAA259A05 TaxID=1698259 RepID=A0A133UAJ0_9EURY|nr:hypothetical protein AKJ57_02090 [candidate division MSBL1 archaeon SCGC-AAA259A05]